MDILIQMNRKMTRLTRYVNILLLILLLGLVLRLNNQLDSGFFYDEAVYVDLSHHLINSQFYADAIFYQNPILYPLFLKVWALIFGYDEWIIRLSSIILSLLTIILIYSLGDIYRSKKIGLIVALLLTLNVMHQQYSQNATMHMLLAFLTLLSVYSFHKNNRRLLITSTVLAMYTHYLGLLIPVGLFIVYASKDNPWKAFNEIRIYVLAYLPWSFLLFLATFYHTTRVEGVFSMFSINTLILQSSAAITIGFIIYSLSCRKYLTHDPGLVLCWLFVVISPFLLPFQRYSLFILPLFLLYGFIGIARLLGSARYKWFISLILLGFFIPNLHAYGIFSPDNKTLDIMDMIQMQDWKEVVGYIEGGSIYTNNLPSMKYYLDVNKKNNKVYRDIWVLNSSEKPRYSVIQKYPGYEKIQLILEENNYSLKHDLKHTLIFEKV